MHTFSATADSPAGPTVQGAALLTVKQAAKHLGLSRSTLYALMDRGELSYFQFGRARRIDPSDLESLKQASRVGPGTT